MLNEVSKKYKKQIIQYNSGGCGVADFRSNSISKNDTCKKYIDQVSKEIMTKAKSGDILFLASLRLKRFCDQFAIFDKNSVLTAQNGNDALNNRKILVNETIEFLKPFEKLNMHIIIDEPKPIFEAPPYRCSDWFNKNNPICKNGFSMDRAFLLQYRQSVVDAMYLVKEKVSNVIIWDPFPLLCKDTLCNAFENNKPLFFDADHLSGYGNMVLVPAFSKLIEGIFIVPKAN